jgi:NAD(P)H-hydrate epimerase
LGKSNKDSEMKILSAQQIQRADAFTITNEPITSVDLMERASSQVFLWLKKTFQSKTHFDVFCGPGNNGGDGLAIARMLVHADYSVKVWCVGLGKLSADNQINRNRLESSTVEVFELNENNYPQIQITGVVIDAIFGSGLTRFVTGWVGNLIDNINKESVPKVSVDIASGLFSEDNDKNEGVIFQPDHTLTFELEKLAFQFPENQKYVGALKVLPIGLSSVFISKEHTSYFITSELAIKLMPQKGDSFAYKNTFGHALLVTGSTGKMGASVLCAKACLKSGAGLVTAHIPKNGNTILQVSIPEVMTIPDSSADCVSDKIDVSNYQSIGIGPGLGQEKDVLSVLINILDKSKKPLIIDADAINVLANNQELLKTVPVGSILTPHLGEWKRMVGHWKGGYDRLQTAQAFCQTYNVFVVLKGAKSSIVCPDGEVYFNSTGNSGMATAGSGDVLTGILTGLLAQGYGSKQAAILGVYIHGLAGDFALKNGSRESVIASDIIANLGKAFKKK